MKKSVKTASAKKPAVKKLTKVQAQAANNEAIKGLLYELQITMNNMVDEMEDFMDDTTAEIETIKQVTNNNSESTVDAINILSENIEFLKKNPISRMMSESPRAIPVAKQVNVDRYGNREDMSCEDCMPQVVTLADIFGPNFGSSSK